MTGEDGTTRRSEPDDPGRSRSRHSCGRESASPSRAADHVSGSSGFLRGGCAIFRGCSGVCPDQPASAISNTSGGIPNRPWIRAASQYLRLRASDQRPKQSRTSWPPCLQRGKRVSSAAELWIGESSTRPIISITGVHSGTGARFRAVSSKNYSYTTELLKRKFPDPLANFLFDRGRDIANISPPRWR